LKLNVIFIFIPVTPCSQLLENHVNPPAPPPSRTDSPDVADDCRCLCGSLLARHVAGGVELKCRRCKRTLLVPFEVEASGEVRARSVESIPVRRTA
jgi:phage FluMu protein Com